MKAHRLQAIIVGGFIGAFLFMIMGYFVPYYYYGYIDHSEHYYIIPNPLTVDNRDTPFKPCDIVLLKGKRTSDIAFTTNTSIDLKRVAQDGETTKIFTSQSQFHNVEQGDINIESEFLLPCNLNTGVYHLSGVVEYEIWGIRKTYYWESERFNVEK